ncbi:unnamed protein product [Agarophyton chilense]|eukprot:gb/GEZJ01002708.1/.p1 GENE.gb/GEZJ01002708.1/~~gb/GEZJ01002708.1/.p1  ORF type:complete len:893 (+),score=107.33 gb/GEZJ01002708.1/:5704-8382(+)
MLFASDRSLKLLAFLFLISLLFATFIQYNDNAYSHFEHSVDRVLNGLYSTPVDSEPTPSRRWRAQKLFLSPSHYQRDRAGAIDVFEKDGISVCRVYRVCRLKNGKVYLPRWMKDHLSILNDKCGLVDVHFAPVKSLKNEFGTSIYYDWLGPNMPTPALVKFVKNPLPYFFAHKSATRSKLDQKSTRNPINRTCIPAPADESSAKISAVCNSRPEGRIAHPAIVVNADEEQPKAHSDFYQLMRSTYKEKHGESMSILDPSSGALKRPKLCFRSVIVSGTADYFAGLTTHRTANSSQNATAVRWSFKHENDLNVHNISNTEETGLLKQTKNKTFVGEHSGPSTNGTVETLPTFEEFESSQFRSEQKESETAIRLETEGGVELFTHRAVDGIQWNNSHTGKLSEHVYGICRVYRACRGPDQSIVLPNWMNKSAARLKNHCGIESISFLPDDEFDLTFEKIKVSSRNRRARSVVASQPDMEVFFDLIGTREYRTQKHHFVTDFLHDGIHALDALYNRDDTGMTSFRRRCIYRPDSKVGREAHEIGTCAHGPMKAEDLKPLFLVNNRFQSSSIHGKFIRQLAEMMPPKNSKGPGFILGSELSKSGYKQSTCFRSIIVTRNAYPPSSVLEASERNIFFAQNNISRDAPKPIVEGECRVRVSFMAAQKQKKQSTWAQGEGDLVNEEDIISAIKTVGHTMAERAGASNPKIEVRRIKRAGHNLSEDKKRIQESEVIISANNPSLTSIMFARPQTLILEVQPFSYAAGPYRSFAGAFKLQYRSMMANPDYETFEKCVKDNFNMDWSGNVSEAELEVNKRGLLKLYREARDRFDGTVSDLHLEHRHTSRGVMRKYYIPKERVCARAQRLKVDANLVAVIVGKHAANLCQRHTEGRSKLEATM